MIYSFALFPIKGICDFAGLSQIIEYIENLRFTEEDINYLRTKTVLMKLFELHKGILFYGDIYSVPEGTVVFPMNL